MNKFEYNQKKVLDAVRTYLKAVIREDAEYPMTIKLTINKDENDFIDLVSIKTIEQGDTTENKVKEALNRVLNSANTLTNVERKPLNPADYGY